MSACTRLLSSVSIAALAVTISSVSALSQVINLDEIIVSASRDEQKHSQTGSVVTIIDQLSIDENSFSTVADYLTTVPGINISSSGGKGTISTFMLRGLAGEYSKTYVNSIDVSDVTFTRIQSHPNQFLSGMVNRIEILKGSQGTHYGSDAIAGVINISTIGGIQAGIEHGLAIEAGSQGTVTGTYDLQAGFDRGQVGLTLTGFHTDGFSAAAAGTEDDAFDNATGTIAGRYEITPDFIIFGSGLIINSKTEFDDAYTSLNLPDDPYASYLDDSNAVSSYRQVAGRVGAEFNLIDDRLRNILSFQMSDSHRSSTDGDGKTSYFDGSRSKLDYQGMLTITPELSLNFGAEWQRMEAETSAPFNKSTTLYGGWTEALYQPFENLSLTAGLRHDDHSSFGGHTSWRITGSYGFVDTQTRVHSSVGTGYRAPSLFEIYDTASGNHLLTPETSLGFDIGLEQRFMDDRLVADLTYFQLDIKDYIDWVPTSPDWSTGIYIQTPGERLHSHGIESSIKFAANDRLALKGSYTYTSARRVDNTPQLRVPRHNIGLEAVAKAADNWTISTSARISIDTLDFIGNDIGALDDYVLLNAKIAYKPNENTEIYLRAENLLDQKYQVVDGYNTAPLSVFAGLKARFGQ